MSDDEPKIKVFASDDNLKELGELLSNDSSRKIIYHLMNKEMYTNEIATKLEMRVSLVIHHLKKMEDLGMLTIINKKIKRKGEEHRFFRINSNILVIVDLNKQEIEEKGLLKRLFKDGIKFASLSIAAISTWLGSHSLSKKQVIFDDNLSPLPLSNQTASYIPIEEIKSNLDILPVLITGIVIVCFVFVIWFSRKYK